MRENNDMNETQPLRRAFIRNIVLCSVAVLTSIVTWVVMGVLMGNKCDTHHSIDLSSQSFIWAIEQFVIGNCILLTTSDWQKCLTWPCVLACKTDPRSNMKESNELLSLPVNDSSS